MEKNWRPQLKTKINRKTLLILTFLVATVSCALCSLLFSPVLVGYTETARYISFFGRFFISAAFGWVLLLVFWSHWFRCVYVYIPELFPTTVRSSGTGLCILFGQLGSFLAPYSKLLPAVWMIYGIFTITTFVGIFFVLALHETRNQPIIKNVQELQTYYLRWSKSFVTRSLLYPF